MTYDSPAYVCSYSFSYQLHTTGLEPDSISLYLRVADADMRSLSGDLRATSPPGGWTEVRAHEEDFVTEPRNRSTALEFVLERSAGTDGGEGEGEGASEVEVALDAVGLEFCLPCEFEELTPLEGEHVLQIHFDMHETE